MGYADQKNFQHWEVDFRDQSAVYGLYDVNHTCVYIGQTGRGDSSLFDRLKTHALEDDLFCFWERFTWFGLYSPEQLKEQQFADCIAHEINLDEALNAFESVATYLALPRFNRRMGSGFADVVWYYQKEEYERCKNAARRGDDES